LRISVFTRNCVPFPNEAEYISEIQLAAQVAINHRADLLVLPGWSLGYHENCGGHRDVSEMTLYNGKNAIQEISNENDVAILADIKDTFCFIPRRPEIGPFEQRFGSSQDNYEDYQNLMKEWTDGKRFFRLAGKTIGVLLCGENNILRNIRGNNNLPQLRYPELGWSDQYDVLINPSHTIMGQANLLHKRFAYLSQGGKTVIHCANNTTGSSNTKRTIYVYMDGKLITMGDLASSHKSIVDASKNPRQITVEVA
jgi:hypothetical protein